MNYLIYTIDVGAALLVAILLVRHYSRPRLDEKIFDSFVLGCPEKDCNWYFNDQKELEEHIKQGKHGV